MKKYEYTLHVKLKLKKSVYINLGISKKKIQATIENPKVLDKSENPVYIAIGDLTQDLSLCVPYKKIDGIIRVITFYPAEKGRYELKLFSNRK